MEAQIIHYFVTASGAIIGSITFGVCFCIIHLIVFGIAKFLLIFEEDAVMGVIMMFCWIPGIIFAVTWWRPDDFWPHLLYKIPVAATACAIILLILFFALKAIYKSKDFDDFISFSFKISLFLFLAALPAIFILVIYYPTLIPFLTKFVDISGVYLLTIEFVVLLVLIPLSLIAFYKIIKFLQESLNADFLEQNYLCNIYYNKYPNGKSGIILEINKEQFESYKNFLKNINFISFDVMINGLGFILFFKHVNFPLRHVGLYVKFRDK